MICDENNKKSKKLSSRKQPKSITTWTLTPTNSNSSTLYNKPLQHHVPLVVMSTVEQRIETYEEKLHYCLKSDTGLTHWIKSMQQKGLPIPLTEGYTPPTVTKSLIPDLFASLSTRPKHTPKSSLSTFLKKATDSLSMHSKRQQAKPNNTQQRFSLTLNRFSLPKNNDRKSMACEPLHHTIGCTIGCTKGIDATKPPSKKNRFSQPPPLPNSHHYQYQNERKKQYQISSPELITSSNTKSRPHSTILPHSPTSIFLDRLRSKNTFSDITEESTHAQVHYPNIYTIVDNYNNSQIEDLTPPSSPSSTDSTATPTLMSQRYSSCSSSNSSNNYSPPKKSRTSLLVSPSLSTIRLLSQKTQLLKRQSTLL